MTMFDKEAAVETRRKVVDAPKLKTDRCEVKAKSQVLSAESRGVVQVWARLARTDGFAADLASIWVVSPLGDLGSE